MYGLIAWLRGQSVNLGIIFSHAVRARFIAEADIAWAEI